MSLEQSFQQRADAAFPEGFQAVPLEKIQVNIGLTCNLECRHCHVASSPRRVEQMDWSTMEHILHAAQQIPNGVVDITGGAPEINPHFRQFVQALRAQGTHVMVRTNLTIMLEEGHTDLPEFYRDNQVHLVASLPCYLEENVAKQRGEGVYNASVEVIQKLNALGYGRALELDLVYNPIGPYLPPPQEGLEADYRKALEERFGIVFTRLYAITNMPIGQFMGDLREQGQLEGYYQLLESSYNQSTLEQVMCRNQISVRWDGALFDCDFNLALRLPVAQAGITHIADFDLEALSQRKIVVANHCYGCTAGSGSSCGGTLV